MSEYTTENAIVEQSNEVEEMNLPTFRPNVDIIDTENAVLILADMPGVAAEDLDVTVEKHELSILGTSRLASSDEHVAYSEHRYGHYRRTFTLADSIDREQISAKMYDGVLELTLPKAAVAQPRRITVQTA